MRRVRPFAGGLLCVLLVVLAAFAGYLISWHVRTSDDHLPAPTSPTVLSAAGASPSSSPTSPAALPARVHVEAALSAALSDRRLGGRVLAEVTDGATQTVLLDRGATTPAAPASTAKLATAVAVLSVRSAAFKITTRVVSGASSGTVVFVGGGDPTLSGAPAGQPTRYPNAARISDLATQLRHAGTSITRVLVDDSLFSGPAVSPAWSAGDVPSGYAAPIAAAMIDGGRNQPTDVVRSGSPAVAAGRALAAALGVNPDTVTTGRAAPTARTLALVQSAPLSDLIDQMLLESDNVIAECLARQVALARSGVASFDGAALAVREVLADDGIALNGKLLDGSGLAPADRLPPSTVVALLNLAGFGPRPQLRAVIEDLPVAGWSGTLADRYTGSGGAGFVRAKTGTLAGVSALAGLVEDRDGRVLTFSLVADRVGPTPASQDEAEAALDAVATVLANCGCH